MNDFRKKIENNRDLFDDKEPSAGHMMRFQSLLDKQEKETLKQKPIRRANLVTILSIAASIAILIVVVVKFYSPQDIQVATVPATEDTNMNTEFLATNNYYNQQMEEQIADIMCKMAHTDIENQVQLAADLEKIKERNVVFVNEMEKNDNKEIAIRYLVKHYKANIEALENINEKLGKYAKC